MASPEQTGLSAIENAQYSARKPMVPGLGLPVWGAFLLITPPLCLILFVVTYLAFRWRWWKAGVTI
jgi:hypothetical protein